MIMKRPARRNLEQDVSTARRREFEIFSALARVVVHGHEFNGDETPDAVRQLGYAADLARGRVDDPQGNLGKIVSQCAALLEGTGKPDRRFRDPVHARWGAPWHMDVGRIRTELPLHVMMLKRTHGEIASPDRA